MAKRPDTAGKIFAATFKLAAKDGWHRITVEDIAAEAKVRPADAHKLFESKRAILTGFAERIDERSLAEPAEDGTARDRLFELLMRRFDAFAPYRDDIARWARRPLAIDPCTLLCGGARLKKSMAATLEAAGIGIGGPLGKLRTKGLIVVYLGAARAWIDDDSSDLAHTMAALDKYLRRAEGMAELCAGRGLRRAARAA